MSTKAKTEFEQSSGSAGGVRSEPGGRAQRPAGGARLEIPDAVRDRLSDEVIDELLAGARSEEEIVGPGGVLAQLTRRLVERALAAELSEHLGYEPHQEPPGGTGNTRNGSTAKTLATEHGPVEIKTPRDRKGCFEPQIVRKGQRRFEGFDDKILALYARGLSTRDIEAHLEEIYGVKVGRDLISRVTDAVLEDVREWQQRPLDDATRSSSWTRSCSRSVRAARCNARRATSPWVSRSRVTVTCWGCGSRRRRARSSRCRSS